jgi:hypothetical protein
MTTAIGKPSALKVELARTNAEYADPAARARLRAAVFAACAPAVRLNRISLIRSRELAHTKFVR